MVVVNSIHHGFDAKPPTRKRTKEPIAMGAYHERMHKPMAYKEEKGHELFFGREPLFRGEFLGVTSSPNCHLVHQDMCRPPHLPLSKALWTRG